MQSAKIYVAMQHRDPDDEGIYINRMIPSIRFDPRCRRNLGLSGRDIKIEVGYGRLGILLV